MGSISTKKMLHHVNRSWSQSPLGSAGARLEKDLSSAAIDPRWDFVMLEGSENNRHGTISIQL